MQTLIYLKKFKRSLVIFLKTFEKKKKTNGLLRITEIMMIEKKSFSFLHPSKAEFVLAGVLKVITAIKLKPV